MINNASTMSMKVPVVAEVGEVVTVLNVLAVGEVTVVGVVVLSIMHIYGHRVQYFRQIMVHFCRYIIIFSTLITLIS